MSGKLPEYLRNMNLFIDGAGFAGKIDEIELPKLTIKGEDHRAGGMDMPVEIDLGMEKLECVATLQSFDKLLFSKLGLSGSQPVSMTARGAIDNDGTIIPVVINMTVRAKELDFGTWKSGETAPLKVTFAPRYYSLTVDGTTQIEIDPINMIRVIGGVDQLAEVRAAIGA